MHHKIDNIIYFYYVYAHIHGNSPRSASSPPMILSALITPQFSLFRSRKFLCCLIAFKSFAFLTDVVGSVVNGGGVGVFTTDDAVVGLTDESFPGQQTY